MKFKKSMTALSLSAAMVAAGFVGSDLIRNVRFAQAEQRVEATREQLSKVQDLAAVFRDVGEAVGPSVVNINVHKTIKNPRNDMLRRFFRHMPNPDNNGDNNDDNNDLPGLPPGFGDQGEMEQVGTGSGVIIEADGSGGYILTNNHVAGGASEMTITLSDGREITNAKVIGTDPKSDLAVIKVNTDHLIPIKWGNSDQLAKGDFVLAFGSPYGFVGSMTHGIVSALHRNVGILGDLGVENFIQVDAPINPGNSGGPLVNIRGELVGINTAIASRSGGFQGIGFAIPSNQVRFVYDQIKAHGKVTRGWLGVSISDVSKDLPTAQSFGYKGTAGVLVQQPLPGSPAAGKLQAGDIITAVNGKPVADSVELRNIVATSAPGTELNFKVFRNGSEQNVSVKIGEQPASVEAMRKGGSMQPNETATTSAANYGMQLSTLTDALAQKYDLPNVKGAVVTDITRGSSAARAGLRPGDIITRVGNQTVSSADEAANAIAQSKDKGVRLYVTTREGSRFVFLRPPQQ
jgi:serine protease Do